MFLLRRTGESNCWRAPPGAPAPVDESAYYACALPRHISALRAAFRSPDAHVAVVQLAPWIGYGTPSPHAAAIRQAQLTACDGLPLVSVVPALDGGDRGEGGGKAGDIHPREKRLVGRRTAAAALRVRYNRPAPPFAGPRYAAATPGGGGQPSARMSATVTFVSHDVAGVSAAPIVLRPLEAAMRCPDDGSDAHLVDCSGCFLRSQDGLWYAAEASLLPGGRALLLSAATPQPEVATATACGWGKWPLMPVASPQGIPAFPWNETVSLG